MDRASSYHTSEPGWKGRNQVMDNPFLVAERIYLRPLEPSDAALLAASNNDPEVRTSFFTHTPTSLEVQAERIRHLYQPGADYVPFAICFKTDEAAIGVTALHRLDLVSHAAVFSVCISDASKWGHGYATETTELMLQYAFEILNLHRLQLHVWADNTPAIRIYEKCGFRREGTLRDAMMHNGVYCDFHVMGILDSEWRARKK